MNKKISKIQFLLTAAFLGLILNLMYEVYILPTESATLTKGYTFATNELVTAAKLHSLVDSATIAGIVSADITDGTIANGDLGANSVTTDKILDATITGADLSNRTITATQIATNAITGIELSTNIDFRSGTYTFTNANVSVNFTNSTLGFSAGQIPVSALGTGIVTNGTIVGSTTYLPANVSVTTSYQDLIVVTNGQTSGVVGVSALGTLIHNNNQIAGIGFRLLEVNFPSRSTTSTVATAYCELTANTQLGNSLSIPNIYRTATATNIYVLQGVAGQAFGNFANSGTSSAVTTFAISNGTYVSTLKIP